MTKCPILDLNLPSKSFNILIALLLVSCASGGNRAPVHDRAAPPDRKLSHHVVSKGETLYAIAWRYGIDHRALARRNGIGRSSIIYPGQKLHLDIANVQLSRPTAKVARKTVGKSTSSSQQLAPKNRSKTKTDVSSTLTKRSDSNGRLIWRWPTRGRLIAQYSSQKNLNKGIDIGGNLGEPVMAAAAGVVVYAGSGIRGYGNLLIIKHDDTFLSAYAHNQRLLVAEKSVVKAGQKVAEIGKTGTDEPKLHFEIRKDGKPVNPLAYLPRR